MTSRRMTSHGVFPASRRAVRSGASNADHGNANAPTPTQATGTGEAGGRMRRLLPAASLVPTKLWVPELSLCRQWFTLPCTRAHRAARATCVNLTDLSNSQFGLRRTASRQAVIASDRSWSGLRPRVGRDARSHQLPGAAAADAAKLRQPEPLA